jgi:hypothetical protein
MHALGEVEQRIAGEGVLKIDETGEAPCVALAHRYEIARMDVVVAELGRRTQVQKFAALAPDLVYRRREGFVAAQLTKLLELGAPQSVHVRGVVVGVERELAASDKPNASIGIWWMSRICAPTSRQRPTSSASLINSSQRANRSPSGAS